MAISRYRYSDEIEGKYLSTPRAIPKRTLDKIKVFTLRISAEDRLDTLAAKHLGDDAYWWIIAELNDINWAFDFEPGEIIKIPLDINQVLDLV